MVTLASTSDYWRIFHDLLEACGLRVQLVNARDVKNVPGRPKSDKHDCLWQAKLAERGMLRPSFVPPAVRVLRDDTRTRADLTRDRTRHWQRPEKLLEDALIKVTTVASKITTMSVRDTIDALIRGERDPEKLADLARGVMRGKRNDLVRALDGRFDDHHAELAKILLGQIDSLTEQIDRLSTRIEQLVDQLPAPEHPAAPDAGHRFPTPQHLVSWARLTPQLRRSGNKRRSGKTSKGNPYLRGVLGSAVSAYGQHVNENPAGFFHLRGGLERLLRVLDAAGDEAEAAAIRNDPAHILVEPDPADYDSHIKKFEEFRYVIEER